MIFLFLKKLTIPDGVKVQTIGGKAPEVVNKTVETPKQKSDKAWKAQERSKTSRYYFDLAKERKAQKLRQLQKRLRLPVLRPLKARL